MKLSIKLKEGEYFWGGDAGCGWVMPISKDSSYNRDFRYNSTTQCMPMYLSTKGRYVWSEKALKATICDGEITFESDDTIELNEEGTSLREAYINVMEKHFPFVETRKNGKTLPREFFRCAQFNTWVEFAYDQNQKGILEYAHALIDNGFEPGIFMIDEGWQTRYGQWKFDLHKFPDPKAMVRELHDLGFIVMLWVTPYVSAEGVDFCKATRELFNPDTYNDMFLRTNEGEVAIIEWWNGYSAILDLRKECDRRYLSKRLDFLIKEYDVDGFKFDGGGYDSYAKESIKNGAPRPDHDPAELNIAWNEFGARYKYHEYKDTFKGGGKPTIQRLWDREHLWLGSSGITSIMPTSILQGLFGHPFICPDMIGGGSWTDDYQPDFKIDEELFIRWAELSSMFPMMQFSRAPWKCLSKESLAIVMKWYKHHLSLADEITKLVENAEKTGEPILRCLEYNDPHNGYAMIKDQFMLGNDILVCPIVEKGVFEKEVVFPYGKWADAKGNIYEGRSKKMLKCPIDELLWFRRIK